MNIKWAGEAIKTAFGKLGKYKYAILILLLGVGLMLFPQEKQNTVQPVQQTEVTDLEAKLEAILCQLEGAGEVKVLLTLSEGTSYAYQTDQKIITDENGSETESETVLVSGSGSEAPVTVRTIYPIYQGAVILCQGADSAAVRLDIVNAVSSLTGLGSDKICVIKMK